MRDEQGHQVMCAVDGEELSQILTQISYLCDRLAVELPRVEGEVDAVQRHPVELTLPARPRPPHRAVHQDPGHTSSTVELFSIFRLSSSLPSISR